MKPLLDAVDTEFSLLHQRLGTVGSVPDIEEKGHIESVGDGTALVRGLSQVRLNELLVFENGARGLAVSLEENAIGVVLLDADTGLRAGGVVRATGTVVRVPVGPQLLGRVVDPLGRPLDNGPEIKGLRKDQIERPSPPIIDREFITQPVFTGILAVDALIPLGRGQRELIIGDRGTGKTTLGVDAIVNQRRYDMVSVYVAIGQKASAVRQVIETVKAHGNFERCIFVVAGADAAPGLQWIAPACACTMAEYFRDTGGHSLLVLDDLTKHANVHRQLSLLLRDSPGREAFPSDIFYLHARLLERAGKLSSRLGGGSLSALAIAETQSGDFSSYIPTNLISITDGQIYLDTHLFSEDHKPAIDVGKSVSRVGGKAQPKSIKELSGNLKLDYAQFLELEVFTRFGQIGDLTTRRQVEHGHRIRAILRQPQSLPLSVAAELALLAAVNLAILDDIDLESISNVRAGLDAALWQEEPALSGRLQNEGVMTPSDRLALEKWVRRYAQRWAKPIMVAEDAALH